MKRLLFAFTLVLLVAGTGFAQQKKEAVFAIVGKSSTHDFGTIKEAKGAVEHTFKVKNEGKAPLIITKVDPSCGCTSRDWTKEPIAPGKTGEIKITYDPAGRPNAFTKTISVYSNGHTGIYTLTIKGVVESKQ